MESKLQKQIKLITTTAVLTALAIIIPMFMPIRFRMEPASFTLFSHVPVVIAMFISPIAAAFVAIGSTIGFLFSGVSPTIVVRAATHVVWAVIGAFLFKNLFTSREQSKQLKVWIKFILYAFLLNIIHGLLEFAFTYFIFGKCGYPSLELFVLLVGVGSGVHGFIDFIVGAVIYNAVLPIFKKR